MTLSGRPTAVATMVVCSVLMAACAPAAISQTPVAIDGTEHVQTGADALRVSFIVNFRPSHALGRAQALHGAGQHVEAAQLVAATLRDDTALRGLCYEHFTVGGAEIVLSVCTPSSLDESFDTQRRWLEHLGATPGVAYVERNSVVQPEYTTRSSPS